MGWAEFFADRKKAGMGSFWLPPEIECYMPLAFICGVVSNCGPDGEPLACGYEQGHDGQHAWSTLPTFARDESGELLVVGLIGGDVESAVLLRSNAMSAVAKRNEALRAIFDAADGWKITLDPGPTIDAINAARALVAGAAL